MSSYSTSTTTSTYSSSTVQYGYGTPPRRYHHPRVKLGDERRPLAYLKQTEEELKEAKPLVLIPSEPILFDPKELVLGGETGWKKFQPKKR